MKFDENILYSQFKKKNVIDSEGNLIGKGLIDIVFSPSLEITHYVVGGGLLEEFLERFKLKKDIDPIFCVESIDTVSDKIKLSVLKNDLNTTTVQGAIPEGHIKMSQMMKYPMIDSAGEKIGSVIDVAFYDDNSMSFIVGGSKIEEFFEKIKVYADIDLIVPFEKVSLEDKKFKLSMTKYAIKTTIEDNYGTGAIVQKEYDKGRREIALVQHHQYTPM